MLPQVMSASPIRYAFSRTKPFSPREREGARRERREGEGAAGDLKFRRSHRRLNSIGYGRPRFSLRSGRNDFHSAASG